MAEHPRPHHIPGVQLRVVSFGYGHGETLPPADHTSDVRDWFRDPDLSAELRGLTGLDQPVIDNVLNTPGVRAYIHSLVVLGVGLIDLRVRTVTIAVGCAGGRHRAPAIAEELARRVTQLGGTVQVEHLHIDRPVMNPAGATPDRSVGLATAEMIQTALAATESLAVALSLDEMTLNDEPAHRVLVREVLDALHPDYAVLKLPRPDGVDNEGDPLWRVGPSLDVVIAYCDTNGDPMLRLPNGDDEPARWVGRYAAVLAAAVHTSHQLAAAFADRMAATAAAGEQLVDQGLVEIVEDGESHG